MSDGTTGFEGESAQEAAVAYGGEPVEATEGRMSDVPGPSAAELDAREEHFTGPRKPMGPVEWEGVPPTDPEEP